MPKTKPTQVTTLSNRETVNRRQFLQTGATVAAVSKSLSSESSASVSYAEETGSDRIFFGDIHNHSDVSDGNGTMEECFDIARSHLDFYALTDHAFDEVVFSLDYSKHPGGKIINNEWPRLQELCRSLEKPGTFIPILAYEWTNFQYGHHNVYYRDYDGRILMPPTLPDLYASLENANAMVIPHHTGYPVGVCGKNWDYHNEKLSPFVEIHSAHGSSEDSEGLRQSVVVGSWMGPGESGGSVQSGLARGYKLGIMASTDSHINHPGAYDLGLCAVHAPELTRHALWNSFHKKRIYGVTGDRIALDFHVNGSPMGSTVQTSGPRHLQVRATAWDAIERIEIIKNNQIFHTFTRPTGSSSHGHENTRTRFLLEWGWDARKAHNWSARLAMGKGKILQAIPGFRGSAKDRKGTGITSQTGSACEWNSRSEKARYDGQFRRFADLIAIEMECPDRDEILLDITCDNLNRQLHLTPADLLASSRVQYMEDIPATNDGNYWREMTYCSKFKIHRARTTEELTVDLTCDDEAGKGQGTDYYYVRLTQRNGQLAWSSPIWVEKNA